MILLFFPPFVCLSGWNLSGNTTVLMKFQPTQQKKKWRNRKSKKIESRKSQMNFLISEKLFYKAKLKPIYGN
ncbi:hypothetical protein ERO13_D11G248950v2 [Gossypium hirsutum]|nr:hypothetical protein ERO13_D11G248950v2 [Gossypium hirsutum]